jgi:hypothetical protein
MDGAALENESEDEQQPAAVRRLAEIMEEGGVLEYAQRANAVAQTAEQILANQGTPNAAYGSVGIVNGDEDAEPDDGQDVTERDPNDGAFEDAPGAFVLDDEQENALTGPEAVATLGAGAVLDASREEFSIRPGRAERFRTFISKQAKMRDSRDAAQNKLTDPAQIAAFNSGTRFRTGDHEEAASKLSAMLTPGGAKALNDGQRRAFDAIVAHLNGTNPTQLRCFVSGEGGTGKSHLIKALDLYARTRWGKTPGIFGACLKIAPTGSAAHNIRGYTWQSALGKTTSKNIPLNKALDQTKSDALQKKLRGVVLIIFDEVSMLGSEDLVEIDKRLQAAFNDPRPFGGRHILFTGDFFQLPPVNKVKLYTSDPSKRAAKAGRALWLQITEYFELTKNERQGASDPLPAMLSAARIGQVISQFNIITHAPSRLLRP